MLVSLAFEPGLVHQFWPGVEQDVSSWIRMAGFEVGPIIVPTYPDPPATEDIQLRVSGITYTINHEESASTWPWGVELILPTGESIRSPGFPDTVDALRIWTIDTLLQVGMRLGLVVVFEQSISIRTERLVAAMLGDLESEVSDLRHRLEAANIRAAFLEGQLHAVMEAKHTGRRQILGATLGVVGAVLLSVVSGAGQGAGQAATEHVLPSPTQSYAVECADLQHLIEQADLLNPSRSTARSTGRITGSK